MVWSAGEKGVDWVLNFLKEGMHQTMALLGAKSLTDLQPGLMRQASSPFLIFKVISL